MRLMTLAMTGLLAIGLTSCNDFSGEFKSNQNLKIVHTSMFGNTKTKVIPAGKYRATLGFSSKDKIKLTLKRGSGSDLDIKIKLPKNTYFPSYEGSIDIPASQTGQRYDLKGRLATDVTESGQINTYESCSYTVHRRTCERICTDVPTPRGRRPRQNCRRDCRVRPVTIYGSRDVSYRNIYTKQRIKVGIFTPNSNNRLGDFNGQLNNTRKAYDYKGICR